MLNKHNIHQLRWGLWVCFTLFITASCSSNNLVKTTHVASTAKPIVGAQQFDTYLPLLTNKRVALVVNQSALVETDIENPHTTAQPNRVHLLDALLQQGVNVRAVMSPEHGFRGNKGAGEKVESAVDSKTGLPIYSLYGKTKKPTAEMLHGIDTLVFDIQDVGVRFYTYLSTLHYVLEAAHEYNIDVVVLDRPNPNGRFVDGPVLESPFSSFVGMHPIPVLHGMTLGELAQMMLGEQWVKVSTRSTSSLTVVPVKHYSRYQMYSLPVAPSPNLPNDEAIRLYPTLCFFEGTDVSVGRGTHYPFQLIGHPSVPLGKAQVPVAANNAAPFPKHNNTLLNAHILINANDTQTAPLIEGLDIAFLVNTYHHFITSNRADDTFFTRPDFFDKLAGTNTFRIMIEEGKTPREIRESWQEKVAIFKQKRKPYLLYPE